MWERLLNTTGIVVGHSKMASGTVIVVGHSKKRSLHFMALAARNFGTAKPEDDAGLAQAAQAARKTSAAAPTESLQGH